MKITDQFEAWIMKKYAVFLIVLLVLSCGRWKTTRLKPNPLCVINSGDSPGKVMLIHDDDNILEVSFKIIVHNDNIYTADNILKRVQVLNRNNETLIYLGNKRSDSKEFANIRFSKFQFSVIEDIMVDSKGNFYIQNSFASSGNNSRNRSRSKDLGFSPSYILVFDENGTLIYTLGKTGSPDIPFSSIESLKIDSADRLFVISSSFDTWSVFRFSKKDRDFDLNFSESDFKDTEGEDTYSGKIEKIIPFDTGENLLISVAYYNDTEFKYRKIYKYSISKGKIDNTVLVIPDPKNELFTLVDDSHIYLWDVDNSDIRFMICNFRGDIINNISMKFPDMDNSFNDIIIDNTGRFYSIHTVKEGIELLEWR